jgi:hypothetical protein
MANDPHRGRSLDFYWPLDFRPTLLWDGSSEVTDLCIFYRTRHPHSSPRCRVGTTSPQSEIAHSQSLLDDNDDDDDDDDDVGDNNDNDDNNEGKKLF